MCVSVTARRRRDGVSLGDEHMLTVPRTSVKALEETVELLVREVPEIVGILQYKGVWSRP